MLHLFSQNGYESYSPEALSIDQEVFAAVRPIFVKYLGMGYSARELNYLMSKTILDIELMELMDLQSKKFKAASEAKVRAQNAEKSK